MSGETAVLRVRWVAPMDAPLLRDGAVAFSGGQILAVGQAADVLAQYPKVPVVNLRDALLLPGLVNAHTHLELSDCKAGKAPGPNFTDWILDLPRRIGPGGKQSEELFIAGVRHGMAQCLRFGVTCVGDISQQMDLTRPVLGKGPIRSVSFGETLGLARRRARFEQLLNRAPDRSLQSDRMRIGLSPHAPYTVDPEGYRRCLEIATKQNLPLSTHLAETADERDFMESHSGPFRRLWDQLGQWEEPVPTFAGSPIAMAHAIGLLDYPAILAHVNYCDDAELDLLARGRASVVYCPRTHLYFDHPPHRWRQMLAAGVNVAAGTDSCASSPDLNLVDDLRLLRRIGPEIPAVTLWEMVTVRAAQALGMSHEIGSLAPGKRADLVAFEAGDDKDPLERILATHQLPVGTWIEGERLHES